MITYAFRGITLPQHLKESLDAYWMTGRPLGGFLQAVVDNDLRKACALADEENAPIIHVILGYLYNECALGSWGFAGAHEKWITKKRNEGISAPVTIAK